MYEEGGQLDYTLDYIDWMKSYSKALKLSGRKIFISLFSQIIYLWRSIEIPQEKVWKLRVEWTSSSHQQDKSSMLGNELKDR